MPHSTPGSTSEKRLPRWLELLLLTTVLVEVITPLFARYSGTDGPSLMYLLDRFSDLLSSGIAIPRWVYSGFGGRGSPVFYFYPPLSFYLGSAVKFILGLRSSNAIFEWTAWLASIASFVSAYYLIRELRQPRYWSLVGAALYTYAPFRVAELYSRSSLSSHVAFIFVPWVCLGLVWIFTNRYRAGALLLAISSACLLLTSVTVGAAVAIMIGVLLVASFRSLTRRRVIAILVGGLLAIGLSAYYLLPALMLNGSIQTRQFWREPSFFLLDLVHLRALVVLYHEALIFLSAILGVVAWMLLRTRSGSKLERSSARVALALACVVAFLQLPGISLPFWHLLPPLRLLQGSWRLYITIVLAAAVVVAVIREPWFRSISHTFIAVLSIAALIPTLIALFNVHLFAHAEPVGGDPLEYLPQNAASDSSVIRLIRADTLLAVTPAFAAEAVQLVSITPRSREYRVTTRAPHTVKLPIYYWPLLHFERSGRPLVSRRSGDGYIELDLPAGEYSFRMNLGRSPVQRAGGSISLIALVVTFALIFWFLRSKGRRRDRLIAKVGGRTPAQMLLSEQD